MKVSIWLLIALTFSFAAVVTAAPFIAQFLLPNSGVISNADLTITPSSLDWNKISPEANKTLTVQVTNTGNIPLTLSMTTQNLPAYLSLSWNSEGAVLNEGASIQAAFTLTASQNAPEGASFNFNIVLIASGGD